MRRFGPRACSACALLAALVFVGPQLFSTTARALDFAKGGGGIGMGKHAIGTILGAQGSRRIIDKSGPLEKDGNGAMVRFEASMLYKPTTLANLGGLSFGAEAGYLTNGIDTLSSKHLLQSMGFVFDIWMGFPILAFQMGGNDGGFRLFVEPGWGASFIHGYAYIKGKLCFALPGGALDGEVSYQWTPADASSTWGTQFRGMNTATLRAVVFMPGSDSGYHGFIDLNQANLETYSPGEDLTNDEDKAYKKSDPLLKHIREPFLRTWRIGVGKTF